jgi:hypothetical protein
MFTLLENKDESVSVYENDRYICSFKAETNLDKSLELLELFNNIQTIDGRKIYQLWEYNGYWYYAAFQEWLYWDFFVGLVQHKSLNSFLQTNKFDFLKPPYYVNGRLSRMYNVLHRRHSIFRKILLNWFCFFKRLFRKSLKDKVLLHDDGHAGFRYRNLKTVLQKLCIPYLRVEYPAFNNLMAKESNQALYWSGGKKLTYQSVRDLFDYNQIGELKEYINESDFFSLIDAINVKCQDSIYETEFVSADIKINSPKMFITYDQVERVIPLVIACNINGIKVISYQHGPITKFHAGWIAYGIPEKFCNAVPDQLVMWGEYWRDQLCSMSNKYNINNTRIGAHLNKKISYEAFEEYSNARKHFDVDLTNIKILVPFEFLADNIEISRYLEVFIDYGWTVCVKLRPSEDINTDSDRYAFSKKVREEANFVTELCDTELASFSAVICTQSIFAVEMMRFSVPIWYLDTSIPFLNNIVKAGIAHFITINLLSKFAHKEILRPFLVPIYNMSNYSSVFSDVSLDTFLSTELFEDSK